MSNFLQIQRDISTINSEAIFYIGTFPISNSTLMLLLVVAIVFIVAAILKRVENQNPGSFQNLLEIFYEGVLKVVMQIVVHREKAEKIFPLIGTLFVFIGLSNLIGLFPGLTNFTFEGKNILRTPTSDFNTTFSIALAVVIILQVVNVREWGILAYIGKFFQFHLVIKGFKKSLGAGFMAIIEFFIGLLDLISEIAKVISLSLRLFGNMFAGEVLATIILGGAVIVLPAIWMSMNLLAAVIQTIVFSFLVTAYYSMVLNPEKKEVMKAEKT